MLPKAKIRIVVHRFTILTCRWLGDLLEIVLEMFDILWMTEGFTIVVSQSVRSRSEDADDLIGSFLGRSEGSFRWIFSCQGDLVHDLVADSEIARPYP